MCLIACILEHFFRTVFTILLMADGLIRMLLYNLYNIFSVFCQLCSVLPLCIVFLATSKLKCFLCNRSNICYAGAQARCPFFTSLTTIVVLYIVFNAFGVLGPILKVLGYVKASNETRFDESDKFHNMDVTAIAYDESKTQTNSPIDSTTATVQSGSTLNALRNDNNDDNIDGDDNIDNNDDNEELNK